MTRAKKAIYTSISSTAHQIIAIVCGFIIPRLFLTHYGSAVNGLVASITQFLGFISLAELGVGAVVQSSLYKPLANKDTIEVSKIFKSCNNFFRVIGFILLVYSVGLALIYPFVVREKFDYVFTALLVVIIAISTFSQHYIGMSYRLLLGADQLGFISQTISCIALILNTVMCFVLINLEMSVHLVKLVSSLIFVLQPLILLHIGKKKYDIQQDVVLTEEPIKQKWNGLSQHIASVILNNTDTIVLTLFSTLENVSIYSVYYMVANGVKSIVSSFTAGYVAMFGNMLAKGEKDKAITTFSAFEWLIHTLTTFAFGLTGVLIVPFVAVYTSGISDCNYIIPSFGALIAIALGSYCIRLPYNIMVMAAGHYKQTQWSAIIEALINIVVSLILVFSFGLVGVAIGTLCAMTYRTVYFAYYLSKNILCRNLHHYVKHCSVDIICVILLVIITRFISFEVSNYLRWGLLALVYCAVFGALLIIVNIIFYKKEVMFFLNRIVKKQK